MNLHGLSLIGTTIGATGGKTFQASNPALGETLPPVFHSARSADVERAVELAAAAAPAWAKLSGLARAEFLRALAAKLELNASALADRAVLETGLPVARCMGEIARTSGQLRLYAVTAEQGAWLDVRIETADPARKPLPKPDHRSMYRPIGPVVVFGSSNFPFAFSVAGGDTASAFAAGCPVIVKAHPAHPGTSEMVGHLIVDAVKESGLPAGSFSLLFDASFEVGQALVKHPEIKGVGFTGSGKGGRALVDLAAARPEPIPVYAEMGSVNPVFILPGALADRAAAMVDGLHASANAGVGQFCTSPGIIVLERSAAAQEFVTALSTKLALTAPGAMLTSRISETFDRLTAERAQVPGVRVAVKGKADVQGCAAPVWFETDAATFSKHPELRQEIFGPSSLIVWCRDRAEVLNVAQQIEGTLTATIHAGETELSSWPDLVEVLATKAGRLVLNGYPTGVEVSAAMVHSGPYPSTSDGGRTTSVGTRSLNRWARLVCYQNFADPLLPPELRQDNPLKLRRMVNGQWA